MGEGWEIGVLDFTIQGRADPATALRSTIEAAVQADALGYSRFWLTEHHSALTSQSCPEVLLPLLAERTQRIRVGTGGILLRFYSALKVAQTFRALETLFPGRIELGIARGGPGGQYDVALHDRGEATGGPRAYVGVGDDAHRRQVADLLTFLDGRAPEGHRFHEVHPSPQRAASPTAWLLGSNRESLRLAAEFGTAVSIALFFDAKGAPERTGDVLQEEYVRAFRPSSRQATPAWNVAVSVLCAKTQAEAEKHQDDMVRSRLLVQNIVGDPDHCRRELEGYARRWGTRSLTIGTHHPDLQVRLESQRLIAEAFGLR